MTNPTGLRVRKRGARLELTSNEVHVWHAILSVSHAAFAKVYSILSAEEIARAQRFRFDRDRNRYIAARAILRQILSRYLDSEPAQIEFAYSAAGKPCIANNSAAIEFNVSHSDRIAVYAVALNRTVGIDVERVIEGIAEEKVAEQNFAPADVAALRALPREARAEAFFATWVGKEAYLKAVGRGLSVPLSQVQVPALTGRPAAAFAQDGQNWTVRRFTPAAGFAAAVIAPGLDWVPRYFCWT